MFLEDKRLYTITRNILLIFLVIYVGSLISWIFNPINVAFQTIFLPFVLSGFLYYLLRPFVNILSNKMPRGFAILIVYIVLLFLLTMFVLIIYPVLQMQIINFSQNLPEFINGIRDWFLSINIFDEFTRLQEKTPINFDNLFETISNSLNRLGQNIASSFGNFFGAITNILFVLLLIPILLFYVLKDSSKFKTGFLRIFKENQRPEVEKVLKDVDTTLSSYIQGQGIVCLCVGLLCLVSFFIIGLDYVLLLAVIAGVTNIIPFVGPWIGTIPAVIVALFNSPITAIITIGVIIVIQQIESNLISPQVIGKKLKMHPVIIIFLILIAGRLAGLIGMILAVPFYATARVLIVHTYKIIKIKRSIK